MSPAFHGGSVGKRGRALIFMEGAEWSKCLVRHQARSWEMGGHDARGCATDLQRGDQRKGLSAGRRGRPLRIRLPEVRRTRPNAAGSTPVRWRKTTQEPD